MSTAQRIDSNMERAQNFLLKIRGSGFVCLTLFVSISFLSSSAFSQTPSASNSRVKKRTNINFEDELIRGEVQKPELFYIMQKKQFNFSKLIKLRENFIPEMRKSAEDVPRSVK